MPTKNCKNAEVCTSRICLFNARNELLVVKEAKRKKDPWNLPGGKLESDETAWQACIRETKEETGVDLPPEEPPSFPLPGKGKVRVYVLKLGDCPEATVTANDEIAAVCWRKAVNGSYSQPHDQFQLKTALKDSAIHSVLHRPPCKLVNDIIPTNTIERLAKRQCIELESDSVPAKKQCTPAVDSFENELSALGILYLQNMSFSEFAGLHKQNECTHNDSDGAELKLASHFEYVTQFTRQFSEADLAPLRKLAAELAAETMDDWEVTKTLRDVTVKHKQQYKFANGRQSGRIFASGGGVQGFSKVVRAILTAHLTDLDMCNCHPVICNSWF
jgi:hypothetical protein